MSKTLEIFKPKGIPKEKFDSIFNKYIDHINNSHGKPGDAVNAHDDGSVKTIDEVLDEDTERIREDTVVADEPEPTSVVLIDWADSDEVET